MSEKSEELFARPGFKQTIRIWQMVIFNPGLPSLQEAKTRVSYATALFWMKVVGLINGVVLTLVLLLLYYLVLNPYLSSSFLDTDTSQMQTLISTFAIIFSIVNGLAGAILAPISLVLVSSILFIIARQFGGQGGFREQTSLISTFYAPFYLVIPLGFVPFGLIIVLGLFAYKIILGRYAIQVIHPQLNSKQAWFVVLIPIGAVISPFAIFSALGSFF